MNIRITLFASLFCLVCSCTTEPPEELIGTEWKVISLANGSELSTPEEFELIELQGIDTYVGRIESEDVSINFDIGLLAGNYVSEDVPESVCEDTEDSRFCYQILDEQILATFADNGPSNFTSDAANESLFLDIMRTFKAN